MGYNQNVMASTGEVKSTIRSLESGTIQAEGTNSSVLKGGSKAEGPGHPKVKGGDSFGYGAKGKVVRKRDSQAGSEI